jgi:hypothetical protein
MLNHRQLSKMQIEFFFENEKAMHLTMTSFDNLQSAFMEKENSDKLNPQTMTN